MGVLHESRLDNTVDVGSIGIGERVEVRTRMGQQLAVGEVIMSNPFGIVLREGGFYSGSMYLFAPIEEAPQVEIVNALNSSPDDRVAEKLKAMGLSTPVFEAEKLGKEGNNKDDSADSGDDQDKEDDQEKDDEEQETDTAKKEMPKPLAKPESSVDVDKLPDDIKKAIVSTTQMDDEQLNSVLSEIGDATVKALKRVSVKDTEIYGAASKVQNAVHRILTGNPPAPPAPPKKANKK